MHAICVSLALVLCASSSNLGFDEDPDSPSSLPPGGRPQKPQPQKQKQRRKRRKLALSANIMQDLGFDDTQKVMVLVVFLGIIFLPRYFGFDTRPRTKYGHVLARQEKMKKEAEARRKKKSR